jgi:microsomal epoxide hydrolase
VAAAAAVALMFVLAAPASAAIQSRYFTASDGARLHYLEAGPADGRTLVFVPGWTMPAWIWRGQVEAFSARYHVIAFDPRGQGQSEATPGGYEPGRRGRDLAELLARQAEPAVVVGWSLGVLDTLACLAETGDGRIAGLVLVDNSIGEEPAPAPRASASRPSASGAVDRASAMRRFVATMFARPQTPQYLDLLTRAALRTPEAAAAALRAYDRPRSYWRDAVYSTRKPLLYVVRPRWAAQADNLVRRHPAAEKAVFETAGHALFVDEPERFDALVQDFLDRRVWPGEARR